MQFTTQRLAYFFCLLLLVAILVSKFLMTVAMLGLVATGLFHLKEKPATWKFFFQHKSFLALTGIFFIVLFSGLYSSNQVYFWERIRIKLPFLVLPFVFALLPRFSRRQFFGIFYLLLVLITVISLGVLTNYALHFETINLDISRSRSMPTPIHHIRYSLLTALAILSGFILWREKFFFWNLKFERAFILVMTLFLILFIHVLSVRSGILAIYGVVFVLCLQFIFSSRRYFLGSSVLIGCLVLPILAYLFVPSFQTRVELTKHNYYEFQAGVVENYSDTQRMVSYVAGFAAVEGQELLGVGMGDIRNEVKAIYEKSYPQLDYKLPHNEFIFFYVGTGLLGLMAFTACFFFPLFYGKHFKNDLFLGLYVIVFCSFMVEATIETAIGTAFFIFFVLVCLNWLKAED